MVGWVRIEDDRKEMTSFCIIYAQSVKNTDLVSVKNLLTDGGYTGEKFAKMVCEIIGTKGEINNLAEEQRGIFTMLLRCMKH